MLLCPHGQGNWGWTANWKEPGEAKHGWQMLGGEIGGRLQISICILELVVATMSNPTSIPDSKG